MIGLCDYLWPFGDRSFDGWRALKLGDIKNFLWAPLFSSLLFVSSARLLLCSWNRKQRYNLIRPLPLPTERDTLYSSQPMPSCSSVQVDGGGVAGGGRGIKEASSRGSHDLESEWAFVVIKCYAIS